MIKVEHLAKRFAGQTAIDDLNFEVGKGEIMGILGPNGAGKTTTMRILSSFMPPTSGRASIAGFDVFEKSLQARSHLGYMPENVLNQIRTVTGVVLEAKPGSDNGAEELKKIAGVKDVSLTSEGEWQIFSLRAEAGTDVRPEVFRLASDRRWAVRELSHRKA